MLPADVAVLTKAGFVAREQAYWRRNTPIGYVFTFGVVMGLVVGAVIVYLVLFVNVAERLPEFATLKAIGLRTVPYSGWSCSRRSFSPPAALHRVWQSAGGSMLLLPALLTCRSS